MKCTKCNYAGWQNCLELNNGTVKLIVTVGFGPRIIFYGFVGGQNMFVNFAETLGKNCGGEWCSYGGYRLWHAPEVAGRTYYPDNEPVPYKYEDGVLTLDCPAEKGNNLKKVITVKLADKGSKVELNQKIYNLGVWAKEFACWSLAVMAPGGEMIVAQEDFIPHGSNAGETFLPTRRMVIWPFTPMGDDRFSWGDKFIRIREKGNGKCKIKFGLGNTKAWAGYSLNGDFFVKKNDFDKNSTYPDMGCNQEFFTMPGMLEIEGLSPLRMVEPGQYNEMNECWELFRADVGENDTATAEALAKLGIK